MDEFFWTLGCARGTGFPGRGVRSAMVGESGPRMSTMVGESGELTSGISTIVGESEEGTGVLEPGISIRVGESEGGAVPGEELSPLDGVRSAAPPSPGSEGFPSGRPRENSSIRISGTGRVGEWKLRRATPGLHTRTLNAAPVGATARELTSI